MGPSSKRPKKDKEDKDKKRKKKVRVFILRDVKNLSNAGFFFFFGATDSY